MERMMIDLHSHILPGMDDGSPDAETSLEMLRAAREQGVQVQVLTPHFYPWRETIESFLCRRAESWQKLLEAGPPESPRLLRGSETAFFRNMGQQELEGLCVENTRVLLVELPFKSWDGGVVDEIATLSLDRGFRVVLAHVERFLHYRNNPELLERMSELPIRLQVNAESFARFSSRRQVLKLAHAGNVLLLGSDAHNLTVRQPNLASGRRRIEKHLGGEYLRQMDEEASRLLKVQY